MILYPTFELIYHKHISNNFRVEFQSKYKLWLLSNWWTIAILYFVNLFLQEVLTNVLTQLHTCFRWLILCPPFRYLSVFFFFLPEWGKSNSKRVAIRVKSVVLHPLRRWLLSFLLLACKSVFVNVKKDNRNRKKRNPDNLWNCQPDLMLTCNSARFCNG